MDGATAPTSISPQSGASNSKAVDSASVTPSSKTMEKILRAEAVLRNRQLKRVAKSDATGGEADAGDQEAGHEDEDDSHDEANSASEDMTDRPEKGIKTASSSVNPGSSASNRVREHWPKKHGEHGFQFSWSVIGHPNDKSVSLKNIEKKTYKVETPELDLLRRDLPLLKSCTSFHEIADDHFVEKDQNHNQVYQKFRLHGRTVEHIKDFNIEFKAAKGKGEILKYEANYNSRAGQAAKTKIDEAVGLGPSLQVQQRAIAMELIRKEGDLGGKADEYWRRARDLGQMPLYLEPKLEEQIQGEIVAETIKDAESETVLAKVKEHIKTNLHSAYQQRKRDKYAADHGVFHKVNNTDIVIVVDKNDSLVAFVFSDAFKTILSEEIQTATVENFKAWTHLMPQAQPDSTRHGLHHCEWLVEHPEFVGRVGVAHFGNRCAIGDPHGKKVNPTLDTGMRGIVSEHLHSQFHDLLRSAFGPCTEVVGFFFKSLEPELYAEYVKIFRHTSQHLRTRKGEDFATLRALLTQLMTYDHKDRSDVHFGLAALLPLGDFTGGDLMFRELGLRIESRPGSMSLMRGHDLFHSIADWKGFIRYCVVHAVHEAVKICAFREMGQEVDDNEEEILDQDSCVDAQGTGEITEERIDDDDHTQDDLWADLWPSSSDEDVEEQQIEGSEGGDGTAGVPEASTKRDRAAFVVDEELKSVTGHVREKKARHM